MYSTFLGEIMSTIHNIGKNKEIVCNNWNTYLYYS